MDEVGLLKQVLDSAGEGVYGLDLEGRTTFANKKAIEILGFSLKEMKGVRQHDLIHHHYPDGKNYPRSQCKIYKAMADGRARTVRDEVFWNKQGHRIPVKYTTSPLLGDHGEIQGAVVVFKDISDEVKQEEERQRALEKLRILTEFGTDIVILEDTKSKITYVSPSLTTHLGYKPGEAVGTNSWDLVHPEDKKKAFPVWKESLFEKKQPCRSEFRARHKKGHYVWFEVICTPVLTRKKEVKNVISVFRNITERMEIEEKFKLITDYSSDIIALRDTRGKILYLSPSAKTQLGIVPEKQVGKYGFILLHPEEQEAFEKGWQETVIQKGKTFTTDVRLKNPEGEWEWFESVSNPVLDETGKVMAVVSASRNITQYKKAENEALQLGRIIENSLNEIYVMDAKTLKFKMVNRGARENLGYSMAELREMTPVDLKIDISKREFNNRLKPLLDHKQEQIYFETRHLRKDGSFYDVEVYLQLSETVADPVLVAIIEDITEKKLTLHKLQQANKMEAIGNLTGGVAHDFNNLLTAIQGSLQLIQYHEKPLSKEARECLEIALKSTKRGAALTNKLLAFSRKQHLKPKVFDVREMISEFIPLLKRTIPQTISIETHMMADAAPIEVDESLFESALLNLSLNARDAMPDGGHLIFELEEKALTEEAAGIMDLVPGKYILISVSDTGAGIPAEFRERIFDPFFTTKDLDKGTGLGLSMVYGFVKQSKGYITVYSEEGVGTTFKMYFLKASNRKDSHKNSPGKPGLVKFPGGTILLVEDDDGVREFISNALKTKGFEILTAKDGIEAKRKIKKAQKIDLLITDIVLPKGKTGVDVGKIFSKAFPGKPIIYSSGYPEMAGSKNIPLPKGARLLSKPYDLEVLFERILEKLT